MNFKIKKAEINQNNTKYNYTQNLVICLYKMVKICIIYVALARFCVK